MNAQMLYQLSLKDLFKPGDKVKFLPSAEKLDRKSHYQASKVVMPKYKEAQNLQKMQQSLLFSQTAALANPNLQEQLGQQGGNSLKSIFNQINQSKLQQTPSVEQQNEQLQRIASENYANQANRNFNPLQFKVPLANLNQEPNKQIQSFDSNLLKNKKPQPLQSNNTSLNTQISSVNVFQFDQQQSIDQRLVGEIEKLKDNYGYIKSHHWNTNLFFHASEVVNTQFSLLKVSKRDRLKSQNHVSQSFHSKQVDTIKALLVTGTKWVKLIVKLLLPLQIIWNFNGLFNSSTTKEMVKDSVIFSMVKSNKSQNNVVAAFVCRLGSQGSSQVVDDQTSDTTYEGKVMVTLKPSLDSVLGHIGIIQYVDHYGKVDRVVFTKYGLGVAMDNNPSFGDNVQFQTRTRVLDSQPYYGGGANSNRSNSGHLPSQNKIIETCAVNIQPKVFQGRVVTLKGNGQYGFIAYKFEGIEKEIFFHGSELQGDGIALQKNDVVQFVRAINQQTTQPNAKKVKKLATPAQQQINTQHFTSTQFNKDYMKPFYNNPLYSMPQQLSSIDYGNNSELSSLQQVQKLVGQNSAQQALESGQSFYWNNVDNNQSHQQINTAQQDEKNLSQLLNSLTLDQKLANSSNQLNLPKATIVRLEDLSNPQYSAQNQQPSFQPDNFMPKQDLFSQQYSNLQQKFDMLDKKDQVKSIPIPTNGSQQQRKKYINPKQGLQQTQIYAKGPENARDFQRQRQVQLPNFIDEFLQNKKANCNCLSPDAKPFEPKNSMLVLGV